MWAVTDQVRFGDRVVGVDSIPFAEQAERRATIEQPFEGASIRSQQRSQISHRGWSVMQAVEEAHRNRGEHGLRSAEGFNQIANGGWVGKIHERRKWS